MQPDAGCTIHRARLGDLRDHHAALLSPAEHERRARFKRSDDRDRFTLGAALLRLAVGRWTGTEPSTVEVTRTCDECGRQHGRPRVGHGVHASVSHSGDLVVVATTVSGPVGIDVEQIGAAPSPGLASAVCASTELASVVTPADFFTYWVRKEAYLKATGEGLRRDMTDVVVTPPGTAPALVALAGGSAPSCAMAAVEVDGYAGAVAVLSPVQVRFTFADALQLCSAD